MARYVINIDTLGQYYWILKSDENHKIIAKSSESYDSKQGVIHSIEWTKANANQANIQDNT